MRRARARSGRRKAAKNFFKGFVAYDDWKENTARAAGTLGFNALTSPPVAGTGAAARRGPGPAPCRRWARPGASSIHHLHRQGGQFRRREGWWTRSPRSRTSRQLNDPAPQGDGGSFTRTRPRPACGTACGHPQGTPSRHDELGRTVYLDTETGTCSTRTAASTVRSMMRSRSSPGPTPIRPSPARRCASRSCRRARRDQRSRRRRARGTHATGGGARDSGQRGRRRRAPGPQPMPDPVQDTQQCHIPG